MSVLLLAEQGDKWIDDSVTPADGTPALGYALTGAETAVSLSDSVTPEKGRAQNVNDSATPSDALAFDQGKVIADSVTPSDALAFDRVLVVSDSVTPSDAQAFDQGKLIADTLGLSDNVSAGLLIPKAIDDTLSLADARTFDRGLGLSDSIDLGTWQVLVDLNPNPEREFNDSVTPSDAVSFDRGIVISDSVTPSDGTPSVGYALSGAESSLSVSDNCDPQKSSGGNNYSQPVDDSLSLADARTFDRGLVISDSVTPSDAITSDRIVQVDDSVSVSDAVGRSLITPTDTVNPTDGTPSVGYALSGAENSLSVSDNVTPQLNAGGNNLTKNIDDTLDIADSGAMFNFTVDIAETDFQITDSVSTTGAFQRNFNDSVTPSDSQAFARTINLADTVTPSDVIDPQKTAGDTQINDSVTTSDGISFQRTITISETVGLDDSAATVSAILRQIDDAAALDDQTLFQAVLLRSVDDSLSLADAVAFARAINLGDSVSLSDNLTRGGVFSHQVNINDSISATSGIGGPLSIGRF